MRSLFFAFLLCCIMASLASASLKVSGRGDSLRFNHGDFPPHMKTNFEVFRASCLKCHTEQRIVISFLSGRMPITGQEFDMDSLKSLSFRMYRKSLSKPGMLITKEQIKPTHIVLKYMMEESSR